MRVSEKYPFANALFSAARLRAKFPLMTDPSARPWRPLSPPAVAALFKGATFPWWIAGGHAIDAVVGRPLRPHGDIDVVLPRRDGAAARALLASWDLWASDPPGRLRPWPVSEKLPAHVSDVWARADASGLWRLQLMMDDIDDRRGVRDATPA